jgi:hypothetical protein
MFGERRKHQRFQFNRVGKFYTDSGALPRDCVITDVSEQGARIVVPDAAVPNQFYLQISGDRPMRENCEVVWRLGNEVGLRFVGDQLNRQRQEVIKRLRSEAKQLLKAH